MVWLLMVFVVVCSAVPAQAKRQVSASATLHVRLELHQPTVIVPPEPIAGIAAGDRKIVIGEKEVQDLSVDYKGFHAFLIPKSPDTAGRLFITGKSGTLYPVIYRVGTPVDDIIEIVANAPPKPPDAAAKALTLTPETVLRLLRTPGEQPIPHAKPADLYPPVFSDPRLTLTDTRALTVGRYGALILRVKNVSAGTVPLDIRLKALDPVEGAVVLTAWTWPPRLTILRLSADTEVVEPGMETRIFVVVEERP